MASLAALDDINLFLFADLFAEVSRQLARSHSLSIADAADVCRELARALQCKAREKESLDLSLPPLLDQAWHVAMNTRAYARFCRDALKVDFLHHVTSTDSDPLEEKNKRVGRTVERYKSLFKRDPPLHIWAMEKDINVRTTGLDTAVNGSSMRLRKRNLVKTDITMESAKRLQISEIVQDQGLESSSTAPARKQEDVPWSDDEDGSSWNEEEDGEESSSSDEKSDSASDESPEEEESSSGDEEEQVPKEEQVLKEKQIPKEVQVSTKSKSSEQVPKEEKVTKDDRIVIMVNYYHEDEIISVHLRPRLQSSPKTLLNAAAAKLGAPAALCRFIHDGRRVSLDRTLAEQGLEDGDTLEMLLEQRGC